MAPRWLDILLCAALTAGGVWLGLRGETVGWLVAVFFGLGLIALVVSRRREHSTPPGFRVLFNAEEIACEHPERKRESLRWEDVQEVWYITTSDGPWSPDAWICLRGVAGGCAIPTESDGIDQVFGEFEQWFPGFDFEPLLQGGTDEASHLCWRRS